jgi:serine phosphatase RsbU (regulator of sigma subunit)/ligand-binding sensor domain-containing protein
LSQNDLFFNKLKHKKALNYQGFFYFYPMISAVRHILLIGLILITAQINILSQEEMQMGALNVRNYPSTEFGGQTQIFSIVQDDQGVMYFANKTGVIFYDGRKWETIKILNEKNDSYEVSALAKSKSGIIYVAAKGDLGYLEANERGRVQFISIRAQLKKEPDLKNPKSIQVTDDGIYFHYGRTIFRLNEKGIKEWASHEDDAFYGLFHAAGKTYAAKSNSGLYTLENDQLVSFPNGKIYSSTNKIYALVHFQNQTYIQTTEGNITNITNPFNHVAVQMDLIRPAYTALNVFDNFYSSGTFSDGLLVYDRNFKIRYRIDLSTGLNDGNINCQYLDKEGNIWVGTNKGISKVEILSPLSTFGVNFGLISGVESICEYKGLRYFATLSGVYFLDPKASETAARIKKVEGLNIDCYGIRTLVFSKDTVLLVAANNGVWMLKDPKDKLKLVSKCGPYNFVQDPKNPNRVFVANYDGLSSISWNGNGFNDEGYIRGFSEDIFSIAVEPDGTLWLGTISSGILKANVSSVRTKGKTKVIGLGANGPHFITIIDGVPHVGNDLGLFRISNDRLIKSEQYLFPSKGSVHRLLKDTGGRLWAVLVKENTKFEIGYFDNSGGYKWTSNDFTRYSNDIVHGLYSDSKGLVWLGGPNGVMVYNPQQKKNYNPGFQCILGKFTWGDSLLYSGLRYGKSSSVFKASIPYSSKEISFEAGASTYFDESLTEFSFRLVGQDENWSTWSLSNKKSYTNLYEGNYTIEIKARNVYGYESAVISYSFTILPPWYRTIWAYFSYSILAGILFYLALKISNRRIRKQKEHLEIVVKERTAEIVEQKVEIEHQKEIVEHKNRDIMSSIRYAKRLQDAILPTDEYIQSCFKEFFVFFRPKDIVSGDFYWVRKIENTIYFAVVDCTGHGVPGAFVSIVGNNGLNRCIREYGLRKPSDILDKLNELVEEAFIKEGFSEVRDGMDLSLCCLNLDQLTLEYAGANNPIYLLQDGILSELKPDKQPIGPYEHRKPFTNQQVQLNTGDLIYLFTDGYADQFGGPQGKKYKYSQLKQFFIDHQKDNMELIGKEIVTTFENWSEGQEQIDDVCVMGIRV